MRRISIFELRTSLAALCLVACNGGGGGDGADGGDDAASGFTSDGTEGIDGTADDGPDDDGPDGDGTADDGHQGTDDGDPEPPGDGTELCDAGDEAWVKRAIQYVHGRKPESIREVRLLVQMIEQLEERGENGRAIVARGLSRGDLYLDRWKTYLYEEMRVNLAGDRRNDRCYDPVGPEAESPDVAAFVRDNDAQSDYGADFHMADVVYSALRLDDLSPAYRANVFAMMSAPQIAGNVDAPEREDMVRNTHGSTFEMTVLGRNTDCLECHRSEWAVTYDANEDLNRHWPLAGHFELAVYGPDHENYSRDRSFAIFRQFNFAYSQDDIAAQGDIANGSEAFGMNRACGEFRFGAPGADPLPRNPYLVSDFASGPATVYELDQQLRAGFDELRANGLMLGEDFAVGAQPAAAYLFSMNMANRAWREAMGFPLVVANNFPRNEAQRDILQSLTETFVADSFSLRSLIADIAEHAYFNQAPPAWCGTSTPYHMAAVFDPFTKSSSIPNARGNGVGDGIHRMGAWPLMESISRAMWWNRPESFGPDTQTPALNCGENMPQIPCVEEPRDATLMRDLGTFLSDSEAGFEGSDLTTLLRLEQAFGTGGNPDLNGPCTGPLGGACASEDWIAQLVDVAIASPEATMADVASAVKDRFITEPTIAAGAEETVLANLMGVASLDETVADVGAAATEEGARRLVGMLVNTPQFLLVGVAAPNQDPAADPALVVPGTSTEELCQFLAPLILDNAQDDLQFEFTCDADGVHLTG